MPEGRARRQRRRIGRRGGRSADRRRRLATKEIILSLGSIILLTYAPTWEHIARDGNTRRRTYVRHGFYPTRSERPQSEGERGRAIRAPRGRRRLPGARREDQPQ